MSYIEKGEEYIYFDDHERTLIEDWLEKHDYTWWKPTLCGNCCGYFDESYSVDGIGGKWKTGDKKKFKEFASFNGIDCELDSANTVTATRGEQQ